MVPGVIERGALAAILRAWAPPQPHRAAATLEEGADFCLVAELERAGTPMPEPSDVLRKRALEAIAALGAT